MKSTDCSKCIFAQTADSSSPCSFYIIDAIKDKKSLDIKNSYYYINNYICRYGFPKTKIEELQQFENLDIKEYAKYNAYINYYMLINNLQNDNTLEDIAKNIKELKIKPKAISIMTKTQDMSGSIKIINEILGDEILWRLHNFINQDISQASAINVVMSTNHYFKKCNFLWIIDGQELDYAINNGSIDRINHIVNVDQPQIGIFKSSHVNNILSSIFMTKANYLGLTTRIHQHLDRAIETFINDEKIDIINYDEN